MKNGLFFLLSFLVVAFGQPAWVPGCGVVAGAIGFALFWRALLSVPNRRDRFFLSLGWFALVQAVQLSWMTSIHYMGPLILVVYLFLLLGLGVQFGLLSLCLEPLTWGRCLGLAGLWTWMEWSRLFLLTGFTWNPVGLALASSPFSLQFASLFGIYGLSFWVFFVNGVALMASLRRQKKIWALWASCAVFPYAFGALHQFWRERTLLSKPLSVALVQTGLLPEQKEKFFGDGETYIPALEQWRRVLELLKGERQLDLIVLPESAFPGGARRSVHALGAVTLLWEEQFGFGAVSHFPPLQAPFVSNIFLAQSMANAFQAHVIMGLDDQDRATRHRYNAAFHFQPGGEAPSRCEKRVLVPVSEYTPLRKWRALSRFLKEQFEIGDTFEPGPEGKVFQAPLPLGVSICIEEIYSGLMRELRVQGAELFINVTNDVWFPRSRLPRQHFEHGRVRAAENGVYLLRACNTGVTGGADCFGRPLPHLAIEGEEGGVLFLTLPIRSYKTLYTWWGDGAILAISLVSCLFFYTRKKLLP